MDKISKARRSWNMSRIKNRDTNTEKMVRSLLHKMGYRFRLNRSDLPGKPDIVLSKYHTIIFVHGCFWHRHQGCKYAYTPKSRQQFWENKFSDNINRDIAVQNQLHARHWNVIVVWECELQSKESLSKRLDTALVSFLRNEQLPVRSAQ